MTQDESYICLQKGKIKATVKKYCKTYNWKLPDFPFTTNV